MAMKNLPMWKYPVIDFIILVLVLQSCSLVHTNQIQSIKIKDEKFTDKPFATVVNSTHVSSSIATKNKRASKKSNFGSTAKPKLRTTNNKFHHVHHLTTEKYIKSNWTKKLNTHTDERRLMLMKQHNTNEKNHEVLRNSDQASQLQRLLFLRDHENLTTFMDLSPLHSSNDEKNDSMILLKTFLAPLVHNAWSFYFKPLVSIVKTQVSVSNRPSAGDDASEKKKTPNPVKEVIYYPVTYPESNTYPTNMQGQYPTQNSNPANIPGQYPTQNSDPANISLQYATQNSNAINIQVGYPTQNPSSVNNPVNYPTQNPNPINTPVAYPPQNPNPANTPVAYPPQNPNPVNTPVAYPPQNPNPVNVPVSYPPQNPNPVNTPVAYPPQNPNPVNTPGTYPPQNPNPANTPVASPPQNPNPANTPVTGSTQSPGLISNVAAAVPQIPGMSYIDPGANGRNPTLVPLTMGNRISNQTQNLTFPRISLDAFIETEENNISISNYFNNYSSYSQDISNLPTAQSTNGIKLKNNNDAIKNSTIIWTSDSNRAELGNDSLIMRTVTTISPSLDSTTHEQKQQSNYTQNIVGELIENSMRIKNVSVNHDAESMFLRIKSMNNNQLNTRPPFSSRYLQTDDSTSSKRRKRKREISLNSNFNSDDHQELVSYLYNDQKIHENYSQTSADDDFSPNFNYSDKLHDRILIGPYSFQADHLVNQGPARELSDDSNIVQNFPMDIKDTEMKLSTTEMSIQHELIHPKETSSTFSPITTKKQKRMAKQRSNSIRRSRSRGMRNSKRNRKRMTMKSRRMNRRRNNSNSSRYKKRNYRRNVLEKYRASMRASSRRKSKW